MSASINPHSAARNGDLSLLRLYVERGGGVDARDSQVTDLQQEERRREIANVPHPVTLD
jgi:hypothetical protein